MSPINRITKLSKHIEQDKADDSSLLDFLQKPSTLDLPALSIDLASGKAAVEIVVRVDVQLYTTRK